MNSVPTLRLIGQNTGPTYGFSSTRVFTAQAVASGVWAAVAGVAGSKIQLVGLTLTTATAGTVSIRDSAGSPVTYFSIYLPANAAGETVWFPPAHIVIPAGLNLVIHHSGGGVETVTGTLFYNVQPV